VEAAVPHRARQGAQVDFIANSLNSYFFPVRSGQVGLTSESV
jgi:hypothetical protein